MIQLEFEEQLLKAGNLPDNLELAHHNAAAGKDGWRDVVALVAIGRTAPSPQSMEQLTEALSGAAMCRGTGWYPHADLMREMAPIGPHNPTGTRTPWPKPADGRWPSPRWPRSSDGRAAATERWPTRLIFGCSPTCRCKCQFIASSALPT